MYRLCFVFVITSIILSCKKESQNKLNAIKQTEVKEVQYNKLLSYFKPIEFDTLKVYSSENYGEYKGTVIDSITAKLFPAEIADRHIKDYPSLYGVFQIKIDNNTLGLIARTPSEYVPSSIKLFYFNKKKGIFTKYIELAESWGDAGDALVKTGWFFKDTNSKIKLFVLNEESHQEIDDPKDTSVTSWESYKMYDISSLKSDTVKIQNKNIRKKFK